MYKMYKPIMLKNFTTIAKLLFLLNAANDITQQNDYILLKF